MPKQAICTRGIESRRIFEERFRQRLLRREGTEIADCADFIGDDGMTKAEGRARKLFGDPRVYRRIIAVVRFDGVLAQQMRQELAVGDVDHLGRGDGFGRLVQPVAAPVRMFLVQAIDLIIMLAHKQNLQGCQVRVLLRPRVTGRKEPLP